MNKLAWTALLATVLFASLVYTVASSSISENPDLVLIMPVMVGLLLTSLYVLFRSLFKPVNALSNIPLIRQGLLLGLVAGVLLYLQGLRVLGITDALLICGAAILLEIFFQAEKTDLRSINN